MNTEELTEEWKSRANASHYDAHEFDGLRDALEMEAEGAAARVNEFIRDHPWLCLTVAGVAGVAVGRMLRR